jgi:hypothetical protein
MGRSKNLMREFGEKVRQEPKHWKRWQVALVIVTAPIWLVGSAVVLSITVLVVYFCFALLVVSIRPTVFDWRDYVPAKLGVTEVLYKDTEGGFREGCVVAIYALPPANAREIRMHGLGYFQNMPQPSFPDNGNRFGTWRATPAPVSKDGYRSVSAGDFLMSQGCNQDQWKIIKAIPVGDPLSRPGRYYTVTSNREGLIVVDPIRNLVIFTYLG